MLQNPPLDVTTDVVVIIKSETPIGGGEICSKPITDRERYDLDLLTLQRIDSLIQRGALTLTDHRRYRLAASFVAAAVREMGHAVADPTLSLRLAK